MKFYTKITGSLILFSLCISCSQEPDEDFKGELIGYCFLEYPVVNYQPEYNDIEITIEGNNIQKKVYTNKEGQFVASNLETGVYDIIFKKEGYGTFIRNGYQFIAGNRPSFLTTATLSYLPTFTVENIEVTGNLYDPRVQIEMELSGLEDYMRSIRVYTSNQPDVTYSKYMETSAGSFFVNEVENRAYYFHDFNNSLYPPGSDIYIIVYPSSYFLSYYRDLISDAIIYSGVNIDKPSKVIKFTVPAHNWFSISTSKSEEIQ